MFTFKRPDRFCRRTKFNVTGLVLTASGRSGFLRSLFYLLIGVSVEVLSEKWQDKYAHVLVCGVQCVFCVCILW